MPVDSVACEERGETVFVTNRAMMQFKAVGNQPAPNTHHVVNALVQSFETGGTIVATGGVFLKDSRHPLNLTIGNSNKAGKCQVEADAEFSDVLRGDTPAKRKRHKLLGGDRDDASTRGVHGISKSLTDPSSLISVRPQ
jgi:hypothetical protein